MLPFQIPMGIKIESKISITKIGYRSNTANINLMYNKAIIIVNKTNNNIKLIPTVFPEGHNPVL